MTPIQTQVSAVGGALTGVGVDLVYNAALRRQYEVAIDGIKSMAESGQITFGAASNMRTVVRMETRAVTTGVLRGVVETYRPIDPLSGDAFVRTHFWSEPESPRVLRANAGALPYGTAPGKSAAGWTVGSEAAGRIGFVLGGLGVASVGFEIASAPPGRGMQTAFTSTGSFLGGALGSWAGSALAPTLIGPALFVPGLNVVLIVIIVIGAGYVFSELGEQVGYEAYYVVVDGGWR